MLSPSQTTRNIRNRTSVQRRQQRPRRHTMGVGLARETEHTRPVGKQSASPAAMAPEIAADAPIIGAICSGC